MKKDKSSIEINIEEYKKYFSEDLKAIEEELEKSKEYSSIIDDEISKLKGTNFGTGMSKGTTRYIIDILEKAIALQTQRAGLRKDKFTIKKNIIELAQKFSDENENLSSDETLAKKLDEFLSRETEKNKKSEETNISESALDSEIDSKLDNQI